MIRKIPATMATQHPDNAGAPYWETDGDGFVSVQEELKECVSAYQDLSAEEYMWDWEGKYADEAVIDKFFSKYYDFVKKNKIGKDIFLTFRLPNIWHEKGYSLIRALMVILTSEDFARDLKFKNRPLFEVIIPMVERAEQLNYIQTAYQKLARFKHQTFNHHYLKNTEYLEIIPLVESVEGQMDIRSLLEKHISLHNKTFKNRPSYIRPFLARSDPAMVSGLLATVLANKVALSEIAVFSKKNRIPTFPIIGVGSLVFRGGLAPDTYKEFMKQYRGVRTVTVQSAFRYDYHYKDVKSAVTALNKILPKSKPEILKEEDVKILRSIVKRAGEIYQQTLHGLIKDLSPIFASVPRRRERKLHVGFLSYSRKVGANKLPRAISFTSGFYSIGVPPEFIGLGRLLKSLSEKEFALVKKYYPIMRFELERAGKYLNRENLRVLAKHSSTWKSVLEDILETEKKLGVTFGPKTRVEKLHANLTSQLLLLKRDPKRASELIAETGQLRKSLG